VDFCAKEGRRKSFSVSGKERKRGDGVTRPSGEKKRERERERGKERSERKERRERI
jgi:hypothetical protein